MKVKVLSLLVPALLVAGAANAAEIYNKDGNKLDLFGKVDGLHYFSDDKGSDGSLTTKAATATRPTCVSASKAKRRLTIS